MDNHDGNGRTTRQVSTTWWGDKKTTCFLIESNGITVARREDNDTVNGTRLLEVVGMARSEIHQTLKSAYRLEIVRKGPKFTRGIWIALEQAHKFALTRQIPVEPLLTHDIRALLGIAADVRLEKKIGSPGIPVSIDFSGTGSLQSTKNKISLWQEGASFEIEEAEKSEEEGITTQLVRACIDALSFLVSKGDSTTNRNTKSLRRYQNILRLWANGHRVWDGSLDKTLSSSKNLQQTTLGTLNSLCKTLLNGLVKCGQCHSTNSKYRQLCSDLAGIYDKTKWLTSESSDPNSDDSAESDTSGDDTVHSKIEDLAVEVRILVNCLTDLSAAIERPAADPKHEDEPATLDLGQRAAHDYHAELIKAKFPDACVDLIECLGRTSWDRYQRMQQERQQNANAGEIITTEGLETSASKSQAASSKFKDSGIGTSIPSAPPTRYAETMLSFMTGITDGKRVSIPSLPAEAKKGRPFPCTACGRRVSITNNRDWRRHLYLDLQPYTCFHVGCSFSTTPFPSRQLWSQHLELGHDFGPSWDSVKCPLCLEHTEAGRKATLIHFSRHMEDIALAAIPWDVDSEGESDDESAISSISSDSAAVIPSAEDHGAINLALESFEGKFTDEYIGSRDDMRAHMNSQGFIGLNSSLRLGIIQSNTELELIKQGLDHSQLLEQRFVDERVRVRRREGWERWVLAPELRAPGVLEEPKDWPLSFDRRKHEEPEISTRSQSVPMPGRYYIIISNLPGHYDYETVRSSLVSYRDFVDCTVETDGRAVSATAYFTTLDGAIEARDSLAGKQDTPDDADSDVDMVKTYPLSTSLDPQNTANQRFSSPIPSSMESTKNSDGNPLSLVSESVERPIESSTYMNNSGSGIETAGRNPYGARQEHSDSKGDTIPALGNTRQSILAHIKPFTSGLAGMSTHSLSESDSGSPNLTFSAVKVPPLPSITAETSVARSYHDLGLATTPGGERLRMSALQSVDDDSTAHAGASHTQSTRRPGGTSIGTPDTPNQDPRTEVQPKESPLTTIEKPVIRLPSLPQPPQLPRTLPNPSPLFPPLNRADTAFPPINQGLLTADTKLPPILREWETQEGMVVMARIEARNGGRVLPPRSNYGPLVPIKCHCESEAREGYLVGCRTCGTWQHSMCYYGGPLSIPDFHSCIRCHPREITLPWLKGKNTNTAKGKSPDLGDSTDTTSQRAQSSQLEEPLRWTCCQCGRNLAGPDLSCGYCYSHRKCDNCYVYKYLQLEQPRGE